MAEAQASGTIKAQYERYESQRKTYLDRARECAKFTIPHLIPPEGHTKLVRLPTPYSSLPARGVNALAAKLLLALFPANSPFFRYTIDDFMLEKLAQRKGARAEVEKALNSIERSILNEIETGGIRKAITEALKHLLVAGNVLLYVLPKGGIRVFRLDRFVTKRDPAGNVLEIITKEDISPLELPEAIRQRLAVHQQGKAPSVEDSITLYTRVTRTAAKWEVVQEIEGMEVTETKGDYPLDKSPWIPLRYIAVDNEDYGRSFCEEYLGDIKSLEALTRAIVQAAAAAAKVVFLVNPNGTTKAKTLANAESGDFKEGNADDVSTLQVEKAADLRVAKDTADGIKESLSYAFQLNSAIQRNGERVTAEEIRYMAQELDASLGGVHSVLSQELQLPLVKRIAFEMEKDKRLPTLPEGVVKPTITTGIEAIGRGNDMNKLSAFLQSLAPFGPEVIMKRLNVSDYIKRAGTAQGLDMEGLVKSEEQVAQEAQQEQAMAMMQQGVGPAINQLGGLMKDQQAPTQ